MRKPARAGVGGGPVIALFVIAVTLAFGIGYIVGERSGASVSLKSTPVASRVVTGAATRPGASAGRAASPRPGQTAGIPADAVRMAWAPSGVGRFTLYLGSFSNFPDAEKEKARLETKGLSGILITEKHGSVPSGGRDVPGGGTWYRLSYGSFKTREDAVTFGRQLTDRGWIRDFWAKEML